MNLNLTNKNALVCGSTQGLGLASAIELALMGANVTLMARNEEKLKTCLAALNIEKGQKHSYLVADFSDTKNVKNVIEQSIHSGQIFHILVNNTGGPAGGAILNATAEEFMQAFSNHLICNQILVQAVVPGMKSVGFGRIVNIISTSVKQPIVGLGVSNTIRAAVANWSKTMASELGSFGITVNNVLPGYTKTARLEAVLNGKATLINKSREELDELTIKEIPANRYGEVEEFGAAVAFICSPAANYINGINLPVDGGRLSCL